MNKQLLDIFEQAKIENNIPNEDYTKWGVKKGLRNEDGTGVLIGLTRIADVEGYKWVEDKKTDIEGELYYRGIKLTDIIKNLKVDNIHGFEEISFLLLFGHLPNKNELEIYTNELRKNYEIKPEFLSSNILNNPSMNVMNKIQRALLMMYENDENPDDSSVENTLKQGLNIIAKLPSITCYAYAAKHHILDGGSLVVHHMDQNKSIAENILSLLRTNQEYTKKEAELLDLMLVLHLDHGAGNNSTFTDIVVSSTGSDLYSCMSASVGALKGPKHGGANMQVKKMMSAVINEIGIYASDNEIEDIVHKLLNKEFYDKSGLVYGIGHAVYTLSDPRAVIVKEKANEVAKANGMSDIFEFYKRFEDIAKRIVKEEKHKSVSANIDYYSGLIYEMLGVPEDLYTPMFVCARVVGWLAHNIENKLYCDRIVRPAGKYVGDKSDYIPLEDR